MTTTTTGHLFDRSLAHGHGLDTIRGYRVVEIDLEAGPSEIRFWYTDDYAGALGLAVPIRRRMDRWARIDTIYECGCESNQS